MYESSSTVFWFPCMCTCVCERGEREFAVKLEGSRPCHPHLNQEKRDLCSNFMLFANKKSLTLNPYMQSVVELLRFS